MLAQLLTNHGYDQLVGGEKLISSIMNDIHTSLNKYTEPYMVPRDRIMEMAELTADAFIGNDDPIGNFIFDGEPNHSYLKRRFFRSIVTSCSPDSLYQASSPQMEALAIWFPPGMDHSQDIDVDPFLESDFQDPETWNRMQAVIDAIMDMTSDLGDTPQWYLHLIAVPPGHACRHHASRLLAPMMQRASDEGLPCTLITQRLENVMRYQHWGFHIVRERSVEGSNEKFTAMRKG